MPDVSLMGILYPWNNISEVVEMSDAGEGIPKENVMKLSNSYASIQRLPAKNGFWTVGILALSLMVFLAISCNAGSDGPTETRTETREDSFTVGEVVRIVVNGDNGSVTVNAGADGVVVVQATLRRPDDL